MNHRDKPNDSWDQLACSMRTMRQELECALAEAQRRFAVARDEPLAPHIIRTLVNAACDTVGSHARLARELLDEAIFTSSVSAVTAACTECWRDEFCGIASGHIAAGHAALNNADLTTNVNSLCVDTRSVRWNRTLPEPPASAVPLVVDVWADLDTQSGAVRSGTIRWNACLEVTGSETWKHAVAASTRFDLAGIEFADYDDEAVQELLWN